MDFTDYRWKEGVPQGIFKENISSPLTYRIFMDPYRKRISVEEYEIGAFKRVVYDSALFDFRLLFKEEDASWQREIIEEGNDYQRALIRNMEERIILIERHLYHGDVCLGCELYSPQEVLVARETLLDRARGDAFDGVQFADITGRMVLQKKYAKDPLTGDFGALLEETRTF